MPFSLASSPSLISRSARVPDPRLRLMRRCPMMSSIFDIPLSCRTINPCSRLYPLMSMTSDNPILSMIGVLYSPEVSGMLTPAISAVPLEIALKPPLEPVPIALMLSPVKSSNTSMPGQEPPTNNTSGRTTSPNRVTSTCVPASMNSTSGRISIKPSASASVVIAPEPLSAGYTFPRTSPTGKS